MYPFRWKAGAFALCLAAAASAFASEPDAPQAVAATSRLTLADALQRVLDANPSLRAAGYAVRASEARRDQAGLKPPLTLGVDLENALGTRSASGLGAAELTLRLGSVIERGDKRARRVAAGVAERELLLVEQDGERLDLLAETARRFLDVAVGGAELALSREAEKLAQRGRDLTARRVAAAAAGSADAARADVALGHAQIESARAATSLASARLALATSWNARSADYGDVAADLYALPPLPAWEALAARLARNPDLARYANEDRLAQARVALAQAQSRADIEWSVGVRRLQNERDQAFVATLAMPLGAAARAEPLMREAQAGRDAVEPKRQAAEAELYRLMFAAHASMGQSRERVAAIRERLLPAARGALSTIEKGYDIGRYGWLELVAAQRDMLALEREALDAARDYHRLAIDIERLGGNALGVEGTP